MGDRRDRDRDGRGDFRRPPRDMDSMTSLRVGNLPFSAVAEDLLPLFEKYGDVGDVYFPLERGSGRSRGFAFVRFFDKRDAEDAQDALNGRTYDGRDLKITLDPGRPSMGGGGRRRSRSRSRGDRRRRSPSRSRSRDRRRRSPSRSRSRRRRSSSGDGDRRRRSSSGGGRRSGGGGGPSRSRSRS